MRTGFVGAFVTLLAAVVLHYLALFLAFPMAGGEFHGIFAYAPPSGNYTALVRAWLAGTVTLACVAAIAARRLRPLPLWFAALPAVAVGLWWWRAVWAWSVGYLDPFRLTATLLFAALPAVVVLSAWLAARPRRPAG